jgi:tetratricopeptide (TPR) repeat protein
MRRSSSFDLRQAGHGRARSRLLGCGIAKRTVQPQCVGDPRHCPQWAEDLWLGPRAEESSVEKRAHLSGGVLQAALRARDLAPLDSSASSTVTLGYWATCEADRVVIEGEKAAALNPYDPTVLGPVGEFVAFTGHWDEGVAMAEKALKLAGASADPDWWWPVAKRAWFPGEYQEAYEAFQRGYSESFWLSHLDLAYTLPLLGRVDEAKQHVAALLKMVPAMTIREADAFYKLVCFDTAYREKMPVRCARPGCPSSRRLIRRTPGDPKMTQDGLGSCPDGWVAARRA